MRKILVSTESTMEELVYFTPEHGRKVIKNIPAREVDERIPYKVLNPVQTAFQLFYEGGNALVTTSTSSGKSLISYLFLKRFPEGKLVYTAPLKALVSEKTAEFRRYYGQQVEMRSGDDFFSSLKEPTKRLLVCTYDYLQIALRTKAKWTQDIVAVVFDEVHWAYSKPIYEELISLVKDKALLALSATLPDAEAYARWLKASLLLVSDWRPVALEKTVHRFTEVSKGGRLTLAERFLDMILRLKKSNEQVLVFVPSKKLGWELLEVAQSYDMGVVNELVPYEVNEEARERALQRGIEIAFHNADVPKDERQRIETLFREGKLPILIATQTLAYGLNLPADRVIIKVRARKEGWTTVGLVPDQLDIAQMEGRAGRFGLKEKGHVDIVLYGLNEKEYERFYSKKEKGVEINEIKSLFLLLAIYHKGKNYRKFLRDTFSFTNVFTDEEINHVIEFLEKEGFVENFQLTEWGKFCVRNGIDPVNLYEFRTRLSKNWHYAFVVRPLIRKRFNSLEVFKKRFSLEKERDWLLYQYGVKSKRVLEDNTLDFVLYCLGRLAHIKNFKLPAEFELSSESLYLLRNLLNLEQKIHWNDRELFMVTHSVKHGLEGQWSLLGSIKGLGYVRANLLRKSLSELGASPPIFYQRVRDYMAEFYEEELKEKLRGYYEERFDERGTLTITTEGKRKVEKEVSSVINLLKNNEQAYFFDTAIAKAYLYLKFKSERYLVAKKEELKDKLKVVLG